MSNENNNKKLYAVTGLCFFWSTEENKHKDAEEAFLQDLSAAKDESIFEISSDCTEESILEAANNINCMQVHLNDYIPFGQAPMDNGTVNGTVAECISSMKELKQNNSVANCDDMFVVLNGRKFQLVPLD